MENHFFSQRRLIFGKFLVFFENLIFRGDKKTAPDYHNQENYQHIKSLSNINSAYEVHLIEHSSGQKLLTKKIKFHFKNLYYLLLKNEFFMLDFLKQYNRNDDYSVKFFENVKLVETKDCAMLQREYIDGQQLVNFPEDAKIAAYKMILGDLRKISESSDLTNFPKKGLVSVFFQYFVYLSLAILKEPKYFINYLKITSIFIWNYLQTGFGTKKYKLAHRDLTSENIIITDSNIHLIDLEVMSLAPETTDIALFPRYYIHEVSPALIKRFLEEKLTSPYLRSEFVKLTIFYTIQYLAISKNDNKYHLQAIFYLRFILNDLFPAFNVRSKVLIHV